ncbi:carbohydrate ABC transporter substrate-binding protein [Clostridium sp. 19966]|uniref:ABC transporter substrate-binding protein n=1 Tax=Clostridium sp. 19966 TaxID=2768166 RepID=UPI0028E09A16|nr:ABC transporter substrate-binding protein [Clostridium sp. 19966]MDT8715638.1 carbohydrate ABC transporter substrate-binding protein [Clostridium sp. 19966]
MFKYKRKTVHILVIAVLLVAILVSCGYSTTKTSNIINTTKPAVQLKGDVTIWCYQTSEDIIKNAAESFKKKYPEVNINLIPLTEEEIKNNYEKNLNSGKDIPDIIETKTENVSYFINKYPDKFKDLKNIISSLKSSIFSWRLDELTFDSKIYAIPWTVNPIVMLYNKKLCDQYNMDPFDFKTWEDFKAAGEDISRKNPSLKMIALSKENSDNLLKYILRESSQGLVDSDTGVDISDSAKAISIIKSLKASNLIYDESDSKNELEDLKQGKALSMLADSRLLKTIFDDASFSWDIERLPALEAGGKNSVEGDESSFMLSQGDTENSAALEFAKFIVSDSTVNINALSTTGNLSSVNDFRYLPAFNSSSNNFGQKKLWRFLMQEASEQTSIKYFGDYEYFSSMLFDAKSKIIYQNADMESSLQDLNKKINEQGDVN